MWNCDQMFWMNHLNGSGTTQYSLSLQSDFTSSWPEAGPVIHYPGMLCGEKTTTHIMQIKEHE